MFEYKSLKQPNKLKKAHQKQLKDTLTLLHKNMCSTYYLDTAYHAKSQDIVQKRVQEDQVTADTYANKIKQLVGGSLNIEQMYEHWCKNGAEDGLNVSADRVATIDILMNIYEHLLAEEEGSEKKYTHYILFSEEEGDESRMLSALDCKVLGEGDVTCVSELCGALWIESFVSFERMKGTELLWEIVRCDAYSDSQLVALGAYPGSEGYYEKLGFKKKEDIYSLEGSAEIVDRQGALDKCKKTQEIRLENQILAEGLENYEIYPVYCVDIRGLKEKLSSYY